MHRTQAKLENVVVGSLSRAPLTDTTQNMYMSDKALIIIRDPALQQVQGEQRNNYSIAEVNRLISYKLRNYQVILK